MNDTIQGSVEKEVLLQRSKRTSSNRLNLISAIERLDADADEMERKHRKLMAQAAEHRAVLVAAADDEDILLNDRKVKELYGRYE